MSRPDHLVTTLLDADNWSVRSGRLDLGPFVLRVRSPLPGPAETGRYRIVVRCVASFADDGSGQLPDPTLSSKLSVYEDRLCDAVESDATAVLAAVLTFDGARQWVFYTWDAEECRRRLKGVPDHGLPFPVELDAEPDPSWAYLREELVGALDRQT